MTAYLVKVREPKKHAGKFHVTRGVVVAEDSLEAIRMVKEEFYPKDKQGWHPEAEFEFMPLSPGFHLI